MRCRRRFDETGILLNQLETADDAAVTRLKFAQHGEKSVPNPIPCEALIIVARIVAIVFNATRLQVRENVRASQTQQRTKEFDAVNSRKVPQASHAAGVASAHQAQEKVLDFVIQVMAQGRCRSGILPE